MVEETCLWVWDFTTVTPWLLAFWTLHLDFFGVSGFEIFLNLQALLALFPMVQTLILDQLTPKPPFPLAMIK